MKSIFLGLSLLLSFPSITTPSTFVNINSSSDKVKNLVEWDNGLIVEIEGKQTSYIFTTVKNSKLSLDGKVATQADIIKAFKSGKNMSVVLHPLKQYYGASIQAEFTTN